MKKVTVTYEINDSDFNDWAHANKTGDIGPYNEKIIGLELLEEDEDE